MPQPEPSLSARQRVLETALRLFYAHGVRATGIDRIIAESGVAKMSFYRHFPSKADLVCAFLEERHRRWMAWFDARIAEQVSSGKPRLPVVAAVLAKWFADPQFRGCAFINITAETVSEEARERAIAVAHKTELAQRLAALAAADGAREPATAGRLALQVVEGAIVRAQMRADPAIEDDTRVLLEMIVAAGRL